MASGCLRGVVTYLCGSFLLLCSLAAVASPTITGSFGGQITATQSDLPTLSPLSFTATLRAEDWNTSLRAMLVGEKFTYLGVSDSRTYGPLSFQSFLAFDPSKGAFSYFSNLARFELLDVRVGHYTYLPAQADQAYTQLTADAVSAAVRWRADFRMSMYPAGFRSATIRADWTAVSCTLDLSASVSFACDVGFNGFRLAGTYREVPQLTFGSLITDLVVELDYQLDEKTLTVELWTRTSQVGLCLTPLLEFDLGAAPLTVRALKVYGMKLECSLGDAIEFYAATSFETARNTELIGNADYFEVYRVRVRRAACCGGMTLLEAAFYFDEASTSLFDGGMASMSIEIPTSQGVRWMLAMDFPSGADWAIRFGWEWQF